LPGAESAEQRLARLRQAFGERLRRDVQTLRESVLALRSAPDAPDALARMRHLAHGLAGSCGTFGYSVAGQKAAALETACKEMLARGQGGIDDLSLSELDEYVEAITSAIALSSEGWGGKA